MRWQTRGQYVLTGNARVTSVIGMCAVRGQDKNSVVLRALSKTHLPGHVHRRPLI